MAVRLDEHCRRLLWRSEAYSPRIGEAAGRVRDGTAGPVALALVSTHGDGHLREAAVAGMLAVPAPVWMPFVVLRASDWVRPVRDRARAGLALLLARDPDQRLARRAIADATGLASETDRPSWRRLPPPTRHACPEQITELAELLDPVSSRPRRRHHPDAPRLAGQNPPATMTGGLLGQPVRGGLAVGRLLTDVPRP